MPRSAALPVLAGSLLVSLCSCQKEQTQAPPTPPTVEVVTVEQKDVPIYREWVGTLEGDVSATISAQVSGYLLRQDYEEGQFVKQGDLLFEIDPRPFQAALDQANAKLRKTQLDVERYTPLAAKQAISQQELDDAIQANAAAKASAEEASLNLSFTKITSPVDGIAGLAKAQIGNLLGPNSGQLTTVITMDPIRAYFSVDQVLMTEMQERRLAAGIDRQEALTNGPSLELTLANGSVYPRKGRVRFTDNQVDVKTGTIRVVGKFPNPDRLLVPGMFVRVRAQIGMNKNALVVPQRAVAELQGRRLIALVGADNKVAIRPVTTGEQAGSDWVVSGPIKPGDRVIAEGIQKVRDGLVVNPVPLGSAAADKSETTDAAEKKP